MGNVRILVKKELSELLNSRLVLFILSVYVLIILINVYDFYNVLLDCKVDNSWIVEYLSNGLIGMLTFYGTILGIVIGFSSVSSEFNNNSINILTVKPLFRDSIINGKLLGSLIFLSCVFLMTISLFFSFLLIMCGNAIADVFYELILRSVIVLVLSLTYVMIFLSLSMFLTLMIKEPAFALVSGVITMLISDIIPNVIFAGNISYIVGANEEYVCRLLMGLSPSGIIIFLRDSDIFNPAIDLLTAFNAVNFDIFKLFLYMIITVTLCYIAFIRRDVS